MQFNGEDLSAPPKRGYINAVTTAKNNIDSVQRESKFSQQSERKIIHFKTLPFDVGDHLTIPVGGIPNYYRKLTLHEINLNCRNLH